MADPVPLTIAQVAGAAATTMVGGYFTSGPSKGRHVLFANNEANLDDAIASGLVIVTHSSGVTSTP